MEQHIQTTTFSKYRPEPCSLPRFCGKQTLGNTDLTTYHGARWERGLQFENSVKASGLSLRQSLWRHLHYEFDRRIRVIFLVISTEQDAKRSFTHTHTHTLWKWVKQPSAHLYMYTFVFAINSSWHTTVQSRVGNDPSSSIVLRHLYGPSLGINQTLLNLYNTCPWR